MLQGAGGPAPGPHPLAGPLHQVRGPGQPLQQGGAGPSLRQGHRVHTGGRWVVATQMIRMVSHYKYYFYHIIALGVGGQRWLGYT